MTGLTIPTGICWSLLEDQPTLPINLNSNISVCHAQLSLYQQSVAWKPLYLQWDTTVMFFIHRIWLLVFRLALSAKCKKITEF
jgi:hypothetical protein